MKGSLRQLLVFALVFAFAPLAVGAAGAAAQKPCKRRTVKTCKKPHAKKPRPRPKPKSPPAPTSTPAPPPSPTPTPDVTLTIGPGMPEPQATAIRTGVEIAKQFFPKLGAPSNWHADVYAEPTFDAIVADYAKVNGNDAFVRTQCANGCAFASQHDKVFIFPFGSSFPRPDELVRHTLIPVHELWHTVQYALAPQMDATGADGLFVDGPTWLREGSAEYVGYAALLDAGIDASSVRGANVYDQRNRYGGVSLESTATGQGNGGAYTLGFLAVELLVKDGGGVNSLVSYWTKIGEGTAWPAAFQRVFGRTIEQFYAEFAAYRQSL